MLYNFFCYIRITCMIYLAEKINKYSMQSFRIIFNFLKMNCILKIYLDKYNMMYPDPSNYNNMF